MNRPVFVIVTNEQCGACHRYREKIRDDLFKKLDRSILSDVIEIHLPSMVNKSPLDDYHPKLKEIVAWYPNFMLFTSESWNNKKGNLVTEIMNGSFIEGKIQLVGGVPFTPEGIIDWIRSKTVEANGQPKRVVLVDDRYFVPTVGKKKGGKFTRSRI